MKNITNDLLSLEKDFNTLVKKFEKLHLVFLFIYFIPPVLSVFIFSKFFKNQFSTLIKIILFSIIVLGIIIHYYLRSKYHKSKSGFKNFIKKRLDEISLNNKSIKNFNQIVVESTRNIFKKDGVAFSNTNINNSPFWNLVFINLGIEIFNK